MISRIAEIIAGRPSRPLHEDDGGQISALAVLAAAAFACLLLLVINTGFATSGKIEMQNAADASVLSGATWMARGLNIISVNNVTQVQLLALIIVLRALDDALPLAIDTLYLELPACGLLLYGAPICVKIITAQIKILNGVKNVVDGLEYLYGDNRMLWRTAKLLGTWSKIVAYSFPLIGMGEAYRIATVDGADVGLLIPARLPNFQLDKPLLPVHEGKVKDLCDRVDGPVWDLEKWFQVGSLLFINSGLNIYLRLAVISNKANICQGTSKSEPKKPMESVDECLAKGGGTMYWQHVYYDTKASYSNPPPDAPDTSTGEPYSVKQSYPCSKSAAPCPFGMTKCDKSWLEVLNQKQPDGTIKKLYIRHVDRWQFVYALGKDQPPPAAGSGPTEDDDSPHPWLLGAEGRLGEEEIRKDLRSMAVAYRRREMPVAPLHFVSPWGPHRITYGQARVYNDTAFDTFTSDWRVTLDRTSMLEDGTLLDGLRFGQSGLQQAKVLDKVPESAMSKITDFFGLLLGKVLETLNNH